MLLAETLAPAFSWNPVADLREMWAYPFMVNAFRAGAVVAVVAPAVGWFMVLRRQTFAGHTLSVVAFPGAALATLLGISTTLGYLGACLTAALVIAALRERGRSGGAEESAATATVQAFALACGFLFVTLYKGLLGGPQALLFGTFLGITTGQVGLLAAVGAVVLALLAVIGRPLLFASIDGDVAAARGVPVRLLGAGFLLLLGAATAEAGQITGSLLVFALLVMPAATAQVLTARPVLGLVLAVAFGLGACWLGLIAAFYQPYPLGFFVTTFAFAGFLLAHLGRALAGALGRAAPRTGVPA
ncbi:ABC transporter permease [Kitasatospora xanthocidica]|uniref:metal ABC transporter permease n=1 Tax=Kitasatospora xanthocidica TaxID=83382 RepID=UPI0019869FA3|nr:metal ABC transporter permease [Kitasatospora xanthocidica]GHF38016.1 ABC transporter permease [Kitasatospora xanthocidica]